MAFEKRPHENRRLKISKSGYWYIFLSLGMGFLAISTGNNILYLLESFLLGGLLLSGVLSEWAVSSISLEWVPKQAIAGKPTRDIFIIQNRSRIPLYCIEIGTWCDGKLKNILFIPEMLPQKKIHSFSNEIYLNRGLHHWEAVSISCEFPFGFAKKIRNIYQSRHLPYFRKVWPASSPKKDATLSTTTSEPGNASVQRSAVGTSLSEGEIRQLQPGEDYRHVVWTLSAKRGEPFVRTRVSEKNQFKVFLDLRSVTENALEDQISKVARLVYENSDPSNIEENIHLVIQDSLKSRSIFGGKQALDELAVILPEPAPSAQKSRRIKI